jgi:peptidyl-tRNA hydrolase, PTH1 family
VKFLIVGLGNIGSEYDGTRHNIGFDIADALAKDAGASFVLDRLAHHAVVKHKGKSLHVIKPTTYMNLSGTAVRYWLQKLDIPKEQMLVLLDDVALPFGKIRMRASGSPGGHNGLKNIDALLETNNYPRLRFGVGNAYPRGRQVEYVLGRWTEEQRKDLPELVKKSCEAVYGFATIGLERAMNLYNTK